MDQRYRIPPLAALNAFAAFARTGGIRRAAAELRMDHAAVSRHLRELEHRLGTTLRDRTTGNLTLAGHTYYSQIAPLLEGLARATADIKQQAPHLTVTCAHGFAYHWLLPRLAAFRRAHPDIDLLLRPVDANTGFHGTGIETDSHADIFYDRDSTAPTTQRDIRSVAIARPAVFPVISPAGLAALGGQPHTWADLLNAPLLLEEDDSEWRLWFDAHHVPFTHVPSAGRLWQAHITLAAARAGEGIALANVFLLGDALQTGQLVRLHPKNAEADETPLGSYVLRASERAWDKKALSVFRAWLLEQVAIQATHAPETDPFP
ncbi:LysR substrate-binding domain-containing protein [Acetobacter orientalis]|uniref:LysR substrate-binding domain-containing protein n=1 Tax=Acetobacter orientalis TaxID=146474 RepID=UPI0039EBFF9E